MEVNVQSRTLRTPLSLAVGMLGLLLLSCGTTPTVRSGFSEYEILLKKGDGYYFNRRYLEAVAEYTKAVDLESGRAEAYRFRGNALMALEEYGEAGRDFRRAIELSPEYAEAHLGLGILLYRTGKYGEAIEELAVVTSLDPWNSAAHYYTALACEKVGRLREAVEAYRGYIHCAVPRDDETVRRARERIEALEASPLR
jgi:tetratricopeptide (TPR) repeat protein